MFDWLLDLFHSIFDPKEVSPIDEDDAGETGETGTPIPYPEDASTPIVDPPTLPPDHPDSDILPADSEPPVKPKPLVKPKPSIGLRPPTRGPVIVVHADGRPTPSVALPPPPTPPKPEPTESRIVTVGMWAGSSSLANPISHTTLAAKYNVNRLDIIVNDHSKWRSPQDFTMRRRDRIMRLKEECDKRGIQVAVMSWCMPHETYIRQMGPALTQLCIDIEAVELCLDAEEPWTLSKKRMKYKAAGALVGEVLKDLPCPLAITGIPYVTPSALKPLIDQASIAWVQSYSTRSSKRPPGITQPKDLKLWKKKFDKNRPEDAPELLVKAALACYRQTGIKGHSPRSAILTCADAVADTGQREVVYWWIVAMLADKSVAQVISILRDQDFGDVEA
jgi:hypothetical protein